MSGALLQFRICYYMFALEMSFDALGVSIFIEVLIFVLILIVGLVYAWRKGALGWS
ncbi:NAD(P)H-quinone oxidoreductase subunit 3 chloroplastic [Phtheirospermum japonicum]|uniref:NADH-ubiquinone oxidoreductase chain 3 n=1 Tax=Phtheirospermum japonicum TaxID=374723 RepID=A0A830CCL8_9LAMI|nr:NAD(P)H-quinone oxidoreductase subunit 3 chloroplastic [Phtheirospermum japonicum]